MNPPKETKTRRYVIFLVFITLLPILPIWYFTTQVYRAYMPTQLIHSYTQNELRFDFVLNVFIVLKDVDQKIRGDVDKYFQMNGDGRYRISVIGTDLEDESIQNGNYKINVSCSQDIESKMKVEITDERLIIVRYRKKCNSDTLVSTLSVLLHELFGKELNTYSNVGSETSMKVMKYSAEYNVMFTLVLEDPSAQKVDWNIKDALESYILPFKEEIGELTTLNVYSQVIQHANLHIEAKKAVLNDQNINILNANDLPMFIDSAEWNLGTFASLAPPLRFLIYVPSKEHNPLYITSRDGYLVDTNAFLIPQWGGVMILNPPLNVSSFTIDGEDMKNVMEIFLFHLRELMGVEQVVVNPDMFDIPVNVDVKHALTGITKIELDRLQRKRTVQNLHDTQETVRSLTNLISVMENMFVEDKIADTIKESLENAYESLIQISKNTSSAWTCAKNAFILSNSAFFDPTMVSLLYFPNEHKYAVYLPLFFPVLVPVLGAIIREIKTWRKEKKKVKKE